MTVQAFLIIHSAAAPCGGFLRQGQISEDPPDCAHATLAVSPPGAVAVRGRRDSASGGWIGRLHWHGCGDIVAGFRTLR